MKLVLDCPNCGAWKRTHDVGDSPAVSKAIKLLQIKKAAKFKKDAQERGVRVKAVRPGKFKIRPDDKQDLDALEPALRVYRAAWARALAQGEEVVYCACGGVVRYEPDDKEPYGLRFLDETPEESKRQNGPSKRGAKWSRFVGGEE